MIEVPVFFKKAGIFLVGRKGRKDGVWTWKYRLENYR